MTELVPQWLIDIETERFRRMGREAYIAEAFDRMREMARKQDARNATLRGDRFREQVRESLNRVAPGYTPDDKDRR